VPVTTLDAEAAATALTGPVVAKIEVEGFEVEVLSGAARFIAQQRPHLSIDIHRAPFGSGEMAEAACREFLQPFGYCFESMGHVLPCSPPGEPSLIRDNSRTRAPERAFVYADRQRPRFAGTSQNAA
jgi:hypothetical protein